MSQKKEKHLKPDYLESNPSFLKEKAVKALKKAKELEASQKTEGKKIIKLNSKTRVLR